MHNSLLVNNIQKLVHVIRKSNAVQFNNAAKKRTQSNIHGMRF